MSTAAPSDTVPVTALSLAAIDSLAVTAGTTFLCSCMIVLLTVRRSSEHKAAECPNPRSAEGVECKRCNEGDTIQSKSRHFYMLICTFSRSFREGLSTGPCPENLSQLQVSTNALLPFKSLTSLSFFLFQFWLLACDYNLTEQIRGSHCTRLR